MSDSLIIIVAVALCWSVISYFYWRQIRSDSGSSYTGFDLIVLAVIFGVVISRIASVIVYRGLFGSAIRLSDFINLANPDFQYVLFPLVAILALQFFIFNFQFDSRWVERLWTQVWFGTGITAVIILVQLGRAVAGGWEANYFVYHLIQLASLGLLVYITYWGKKRRRYINTAVLAIVVYAAGITASYFA
ncbi:hypothetical protein KC640_03370, partial [Candidatus Dojkabacteria bacterium]|nr:hypothetical protein [Candidatus Dojkabacteria bacterium]